MSNWGILNWNVASNLHMGLKFKFQNVSGESNIDWPQHFGAECESAWWVCRAGSLGSPLIATQYLVLYLVSRSYLSIEAGGRSPIDFRGLWLFSQEFIPGTKLGAMWKCWHQGWETMGECCKDCVAWHTAGLLTGENWWFEIGVQLESRKHSQVYERAICRRYHPGDNADKQHVMKCQCVNEVCSH